MLTRDFLLEKWAKETLTICCSPHMEHFSILRQNAYSHRLKDKYNLQSSLSERLFSIKTTVRMVQTSTATPTASIKDCSTPKYPSKNRPIRDSPQWKANKVATIKCTSSLKATILRAKQAIDSIICLIYTELNIVGRSRFLNRSQGHRSKTMLQISK